MNPLVYVLLGIVVVCAFAVVICAVADDTIDAEPDRKPTRKCGVTSCYHIALVPVTRRKDGTPDMVCAGHYDEGFARGWWTA